MTIEFLYLTLLVVLISAAFYLIFLKDSKKEEAQSKQPLAEPKQQQQKPQKQKSHSIDHSLESIQELQEQSKDSKDEDKSEISLIFYQDKDGSNMVEENKKPNLLQGQQKSIQKLNSEAESSKLSMQRDSGINILQQENINGKQQLINQVINVNQFKENQSKQSINDHNNQEVSAKLEISHTQKKQSQKNSQVSEKILENVDQKLNNQRLQDNQPQQQQSNDLSGSEIDKLIMDQLNQSNFNEKLQNKEEEENEFDSIIQSVGYEKSFQLKAANSICQQKSYQGENKKSQNKLSSHSKEADLKKYSKRLKNIKNHYKTIIQSLKKKLEDLCSKHNVSVSEIDMNQTISFSEEESSQFMEKYEGGVQLRVEEVENLKNQLQIHEDIITNIIEQEQILKDQLRNLQQENNGLKEIVMRSSQAQRYNNSRISQSMLQSRINNEERAQLGRSNTAKKYTEEIQSKIATLYASQILSCNFSRMTGFNSQIKAGQSTISLMSLFQGVGSIGLLGECRFLNEISKKYLLGQIKKYFKERVCDTSLLFTFVQTNEEQDKRSVFSVMKGMQDILVLIKLADGVNVAYFTSSITDLEEDQSAKIQSKALLMNLKSRKSKLLQGFSNYSNNLIQLVEGQLGMSEFQPFWLHRNPQIDTFLQTNQESISFMSIYQIYFQNK